MPRIAHDYHIPPPMIDDLTNDEIDGILAHMSEVDERAKKAQAAARKKRRR